MESGKGIACPKHASGCDRAAITNLSSAFWLDRLIYGFASCMLSLAPHALARLRSRKTYKELLFICLSGLATGGSWLCYYKALQDGPASVVVPIDKMSILVTVAFAYLVFKEKLTPKSFVGLVLLTAGTFVMLIP